MPCLPEDVRALALMLPETVEGAYQGHPDFRVCGRIYATLWTDEERVVVKLTPEMQTVMVEAEPDAFEPVPGAWGSRGWTSLDLNAADEEMLRSALLIAWKATAPPALMPDTKASCSTAKLTKPCRKPCRKPIGSMFLTRSGRRQWTNHRIRAFLSGRMLRPVVEDKA